MEEIKGYPDVAGLTKPQLKFLRDYQNKQILADTFNNFTTQGAELAKTVFTSIKDNEIATGVAMWLVVQGLENIRFLDKTGSGFLKAAVVAGSAWDIVNPFS